jgi:hypothetical protein
MRANRNAAVFTFPSAFSGTRVPYPSFHAGRHPYSYHKLLHLVYKMYTVGIFLTYSETLK